MRAKFKLHVCTTEQGVEWVYRVPVGKGQAVIGFNSIAGISIGFETEPCSGNTHLPAREGTEKIWKHIRCNAAGAKEWRCLAAIGLVQAVARWEINDLVAER